MGKNKKPNKRFFLNHKKSSALVISIGIHAFIIIAAISLVAVNVIIKPEPGFEAKEVKRPNLKLRKLQVPVKDSKKTQAPKLRKTIVAKPKTPSVDIKMPEIVGVKGGTGYGRSGGLGGLGFGFDMNFFGLKGGLKDAAQHIVFIIDYSQSMKGEKEAIMRREVARVISELPKETEFGVIFFAGPAWPADEDLVSGKFSDWVKSGGEGNAHTFRPKDWSDLPRPEYQKAYGSNLSAMIRAVQRTPLVFGTVYDCPIYMALTMEPMPDTIFFMTDGACDQSRGIVSLRKMVAQLKAAGKKVPVMHTVGFGISKNKQLMQMAELMGGESNFMTTQEYINKYGPDDSKPEKIVEVKGVLNSVETVPDTKYPIEFPQL